MNRPSFQFYPADWLGNTNLRRCTHEEKGAWMDVLCLLHDSADQYGALHWPLADISRAVGCSIETLQALIDKRVMKGADAGQTCEPFVYVPRSGRKDGEPVTLIHAQKGPIWYSSRMVRDEYVRNNRGKESRFQGDDADQGEAPKQSPKDAPKPPFSDGSSSSSSTSSSKKKYLPKDQPSRFDGFWERYPNKVAKAKAIKAFDAVDPSDELLARMLKALEHQKASTQWLKDGGAYIPHPATWLNGRRWEDELETENTGTRSFLEGCI